MPLHRSGSAAKPLAELGGHSHWVWQARFCPAHDCLLLSASSDALVNLWFAPWLGAAVGTPGKAGGAPRGTPGGALGGGAGAGGAPSPSRAGGAGRGGAKEGRMRAYDDHEDSVYSEPPRFMSLKDVWALAARQASRNSGGQPSQ